MKYLVAGIAACTILAGAASGQSLKDRINYVMQKRSQSQSRNVSKAQMLGALLYTDLTVQFDETPLGSVAPSPEMGQHTEEVLLELGVEWAEIERYKAAKAIN